jgi:polyprenyl-phospho-N-acetylgalactosaminyl synthase
LIIAVDIANKQKFNALHFLVFIWIGWWLLAFTFFPEILNAIWRIFWIARWADVLVYTSIIFLLYFVLLLLKKHVENREAITSLIRDGALHVAPQEIIKWKEIFLIRVFNEATVIKSVLKEIIDRWHKNILVVNDWSTDNSREVLEKFWDKIILINHSINRWAWAALKTGFEYIKKYCEVEYVVTFDADGQHDIKDLENFYDAFEKHHKLGVVLWSRFIKKTNSNVPFMRRITLFLWRIFTWLVSNVYLTDAHNGYRVFTLDTIKEINLTIDTMAYASELIEEIREKKIKFKEVPVNIKYTKYSMNKWQSSWNAISIALRIIWGKFFR